MKGDLVSRKFLLDCAEYDSNGRLIIPYKDVEKAPTAYDKEKVLEELRNVSLKFRIAGNFNSSAVADRAIEIVEKGGLN